MGVQDWIAELGRRVREWLDEAADALAPRPEPVPIPVPVHDDDRRRR